MDLTFYVVFYFVISPTWLYEKHGGYRRRNINWLPFANTWVHARCFGGRSGSRPLFWGWVGFTPIFLGVGRVHARCFGVGRVHVRCFGGGSGSRPLFWGWVVFLILLVFCLVLCRFLFLFACLLPCYFVLNVVSG